MFVKGPTPQKVDCWGSFPARQTLTLWNVEQRRVSVSYLQPSAQMFLFSHFVAAWDSSPTQHVSIWHPGNETQQATIFEVCSGTAGTNPTDSTFNFNSLWILLIWGELQLALTTNVLQRETFYSHTLSTCQSLYSITSTWVKKNQYFFFIHVNLPQFFFSLVIPTSAFGFWCWPTGENKHTVSPNCSSLLGSLPHTHLQNRPAHPERESVCDSPGREFVCGVWEELSWCYHQMADVFSLLLLPPLSFSKHNRWDQLIFPDVPVSVAR